MSRGGATTGCVFRLSTVSNILVIGYIATQLIPVLLQHKLTVRFDEKKLELHFEKLIHSKSGGLRKAKITDPLFPGQSINETNHNLLMIEKNHMKKNKEITKHDDDKNNQNLSMMLQKEQHHEKQKLSDRNYENLLMLQKHHDEKQRLRNIRDEMIRNGQITKQEEGNNEHDDTQIDKKLIQLEETVKLLSKAINDGNKVKEKEEKLKVVVEEEQAASKNAANESERAEEERGAVDKSKENEVDANAEATEKEATESDAVKTVEKGEVEEANEAERAEEERVAVDENRENEVDANAEATEKEETENEPDAVKTVEKGEVEEEPVVERGVDDEKGEEVDTSEVAKSASESIKKVDSVVDEKEKSDASEVEKKASESNNEGDISEIQKEDSESKKGADTSEVEKAANKVETEAIKEVVDEVKEAPNKFNTDNEGSDKQQDPNKEEVAKADNPNSSTIAPTLMKAKLHSLQESLHQAKLDIMKFFEFETRAIHDGLLYFRTPGNSTASSKSSQRKLLTDRLKYRLQKCILENENDDPQTGQTHHHHKKKRSSMCRLRIFFIGSAQMTGKDSFFNQSFPFVTKKRLLPIAESAGLDLEVYNQAMDNDLGREGPQNMHMCLQNLLGTSTNDDSKTEKSNVVDVIVWGYDDTMNFAREKQLEAFIRWSYMLYQPPLIVFNRDGGPHGASRYDTKRSVVQFSRDHTAFVYEPVNPTPEQRKEPYYDSHKFKQLWNDHEPNFEERTIKNDFWFPITEHYSKLMNFVGVDPIGSIWHLDHLPNFSNRAFDSGKALPLIDCGKEHPPPCNQHPKFIINKLKESGKPESWLPNDTGGAVCGAAYGCRNVQYGGPRSQMLRGELNAIPVIDAFLDAVNELKSSLEDDSGNYNVGADAFTLKNRADLQSEMPEPIHCPSTLCSAVPDCITSYKPNKHKKLDDLFVPQNGKPGEVPPTPTRGIVHLSNKAEFGIKAMKKRVMPLGNTDRKFGYRLSIAHDNTDASTAVIQFSTAGSSGGPLILCEPPCFMDECAPARKMPLVQHVTIELDGQPDIGHIEKDIHVLGTYCAVLHEHLPPGNHSLKLTAMEDVQTPNFVMFSHIISF